MLCRRGLVLALLALLFALCLSAVGYASDSSGFSYEESEEGIVLTGYSGEDTELVIPEKIDGKRVIAIGKQAFEGNRTLTAVTLPDSIMTIDAYAFHGCTSLAEISLPEQTSTIDGAAFYQCSGLSSITILHPTCSIYDAAGTISDTAEITGYDNSTAQQYAARYDRRFRSLGSAPCTTHTYTAQTTKAPTCTQKGERTYICSRCGASYTEEIPADGHTSQIQEEIPPTCTEDGRSTSAICSVCGAILSESTVLPARGHTPETRGAVAATCTTAGQTGVMACSTCGLVLKESAPVPATGHDCTTELTPAQPKKDGSCNERCTVCGEIVSAEQIAYPKTVTLSNTVYTYSGAQRTPTVTVADRFGDRISAACYTVSYPKDRRNVGKYTVRLTFCDEWYTGTMEGQFRIRPKGTQITSLKAKSRGLRIAWKKQRVQADGYQVQYSLRKSFPKGARRTVTVTGRTYQTLTKLKRKKTYYVRVRTYRRMEDGTRNVSAWSSIRSKKTRK